MIWFCSIPETDAFNIRPGTGQFRTKGAIATAFLLFGTSFLFVNSHLTAHQENIKDRIKDYKKITAMLRLPRELPSRTAGKNKLDFSEKFDVVLFAGDLNFRIEQSREVIVRQVGNGKQNLLDFDQLNFLMEQGLIFRGYKEENIRFRPTYKYDPGTSDFDSSSKQRTPSYTDRILYKSSDATNVSPICYDSVHDIVTSDHKPVVFVCQVGVRPGRDSIPLAGGLFNRDVYMEGLKRRAEALQPRLRAGQSNYMCSLQ